VKNMLKKTDKSTYGIFGKYNKSFTKIEMQKRGVPHAHMVVFLHNME
jgi:hypothetical protein